MFADIDLVEGEHLCNDEENEDPDQELKIFKLYKKKQSIKKRYFYKL